MANASDPILVQWILDTRDLWPGATKTAQLETLASRALSLLTREEKTNVLKYYHVRDAKMALGSALLKHFVISKYCNVAWWDTKMTRDEKTKPIYRDPDTGTCPISFNVSHQAGLVALIAAHGYDGPVDVGVDVVCVSERRDRDHKMIKDEGWPSFVDMHADVFAPSEAKYLKYQILSAVPGLPRGASPEDIVDFKLRCFYALWCLREAYVKMTGEALLAEWLGVLEFRNFVPPIAAASFAGTDEVAEQVVTDHQIWFRGQKVEDAKVCLRALGPDYMTCTAVRAQGNAANELGSASGPFTMIDINQILEYAEKQ
ncbi:putative phosphopantetheinyl transferase protein [Phaeoacremonium minimum UCRPA7]|uniref:holo-[acyl-carrier-protein] synthase n=1 Tax=Phaeoacremonium minimum (strain UCR-PA7) TaxID=1286976 RepID=R8B9H8_PHAM7|nr:putative phosphopantetheinyl transferase protein [Phaeoacremonium minimum UCRPA7]EON95941.1 putative phosphopantetheinyl transferase protein [Phaeoacremonium minimum UCRPA7]